MAMLTKTKQQIENAKKKDYGQNIKMNEHNVNVYVTKKLDFGNGYRYAIVKCHLYLKLNYPSQ